MKGTIRKCEKKRKSMEFDAIAFTYTIPESQIKTFARMLNNGITSKTFDEKLGLNIQKKMKLFVSQTLENGDLWWEDFKDLFEAVKEHIVLYDKEQKEAEGQTSIEDAAKDFVDTMKENNVTMEVIGNN